MYRTSVVLVLFAAVVHADDRPRDAAAVLDLEAAEQARGKSLFVQAVRSYESAFAADPKLAASPNRFRAACAAAQASSGQGKDADKLDAKEKTALRGKALAWLKAELADLNKVVFVQATLQDWQRNPHLKRLRDVKELAALPEAERKQWQQLWTDADALLKKSIPDYYPLRVGTKWDYQVTVGEKVVKIQNEITGIEMVKGEPQVVQATNVNGAVAGTEYLNSNRQGVFRNKALGQESSPPVRLLKYPVKPGETWEGEHTVGKEKVTVSVVVGKFEEIQVPGGKFKTITVTLKTVTSQGVEVDTTYWYAANVGIVKQVARIGETNVQLELEKYEQGK